MLNPVKRFRRGSLAALAVLLAGVGGLTAGEPNKTTARIDQEISKRLQADGFTASERCSDQEFVRRAYLDLTGVIPTADQARAFLDSKDPAKRAKLIDELLASEKYGAHLADIWQGLMLPRSSDNRRLNNGPLVGWLKEEFNKNTPWDKFVHNLVTADGPQDKNGAVTYFLANQSVDKITDSVTKLFLGVQLQCAQCHNHPFTGWKQDEYWAMAQFFIKVQPDNVNRAARDGTTPGITEAKQPRPNKRLLPESAKMVPAKYLQGEQAKLPNGEPYRPVLADWMTSPKNPFFARAMVNRVWGQLFARGLVNPVDDMHKDNPASHPELLEALAADFATDNFDLKNLYRTICNSDAYQRSCKPNTGNEKAPPQVYSRMAVKPMTPEQLYDSLTAVLGSGQAEGRPARAQQAQKRPQGNARTAFVTFFQAEEGADPTEYNTGIPHALRLMNSPQFNNTALVNGLMRANKKPEEILEQLYLTTLSRRPTPAEQTRLLAFVAREDARQAYSDILWALVNSSEFALNH